MYKKKNYLIWFDNLDSYKFLFEVIWFSDTGPENLFDLICFVAFFLDLQGIRKYMFCHQGKKQFDLILVFTYN